MSDVKVGTEKKKYDVKLACAKDKIYQRFAKLLNPNHANTMTVFTK